MNWDPPQPSRPSHHACWTHGLSLANSPRASDYFLNFPFIFLQPQLRSAKPLSSGPSSLGSLPHPLGPEAGEVSPLLLLLLPVHHSSLSPEYSCTFDTHAVGLYHVLLLPLCHLSFSSSIGCWVILALGFQCFHHGFCHYFQDSEYPQRRFPQSLYSQLPGSHPVSHVGLLFPWPRLWITHSLTTSKSWLHFKCLLTIISFYSSPLAPVTQLQ